jgi:hypothetical protein
MRNSAEEREFWFGKTSNGELSGDGGPDGLGRLPNVRQREFRARQLVGLGCKDATSVNFGRITVFNRCYL